MKNLIELIQMSEISGNAIELAKASKESVSALAVVETEMSPKMDNVAPPNLTKETSTEVEEIPISVKETSIEVKETPSSVVPWSLIWFLIVLGLGAAIIISDKPWEIDTAVEIVKSDITGITAEEAEKQHF